MSLEFELSKLDLLLLPISNLSVAFWRGRRPFSCLRILSSYLLEMHSSAGTSVDKSWHLETLRPTHRLCRASGYDRCLLILDFVVLASSSKLGRLAQRRVFFGRLSTQLFCLWSSVSLNCKLYKNRTRKITYSTFCFGNG